MAHALPHTPQADDDAPLAVVHPSPIAAHRTPPAAFRWTAPVRGELHGILFSASFGAWFGTVESGTGTLWTAVTAATPRPVWLRPVSGRLRDLWHASVIDAGALMVYDLCVDAQGRCVWRDRHAVDRPPRAMLQWRTGLHANQWIVRNAKRPGASMQTPWVFMPLSGTIARLALPPPAALPMDLALVRRSREPAPRLAAVSSLLHHRHLVRFAGGVYLAAPSAQEGALDAHRPQRATVTPHRAHAAGIFVSHHVARPGCMLVWICPSTRLALVLCDPSCAAGGASLHAAPAPPSSKQVAWLPLMHTSKALAWVARFCIRPRTHDAQVCPTDDSGRTMYCLLHNGDAAMPHVSSTSSDENGPLDPDAAPDAFCLAAPARPGGRLLTQMPHFENDAVRRAEQWTLLTPRAACLLEEAAV